VSRLFISHSSHDNIAAVAFKQWLGKNGWPPADVFLDVEDIGAGERWKDALRKANARCEAIILLASPEALSSPECLAELRKAEDYGKEIVVVLLRDVKLEDSRLGSYRERQIVDLAAPPQTHMEQVTFRDQRYDMRFNEEALAKIKDYLVRRGITPDHFAWPPEDKPGADPFPGLAAFTEDDAGIFFGRDSDILRGLDKLRILRRDGRPRLLVIHGASGAGKSSFLRAGLWPRLRRDPDFATLAILRAAHGILTGPDGYDRVLAQRLSRPRFPVTPGSVHALLMSPDEAAAAKGFVRLMRKAAAQARKLRRIGDEGARAPALVLAIDQAEELFEPDDAAESARLLSLLAHLLRNPPQGVEPFVVLTIRAESVDRLFQRLAQLELEVPEALMLPALPVTSYRDIILKPIEMLARRGQRLTIEPDLTEQLVKDTTGADALPLLAFTLAQLYQDFSAAGSITLKDYEAMGGVGGAIGKAVAAARAKPNDAPAIPAGEEVQLALLRAAFIPALARIDPQSGSAMRRVARLDEIPEHARAMVQRLVRSRLLVADRRAGTDVVEVAHESLLRQWPPLKAWLDSERESLKLIEDIERSASQWDSHAREETWLDHRGARLTAARTIAARPDFKKRLGELAASYLAACRQAESAAHRRKYGMQAAVATLVVVLGLGLAAWWQQHWFKERAYWLLHARGQALTAEQERARTPQDPPFKECTDCPEMVVLPAGRFLMGSIEGMGAKTEQPQHLVTIGEPLVVGKFEVTFMQWDACARWGDCDPRIPSGDWGRGDQPAINLTLEDAQRYVAWLSRMTGKPYRLLTEAEWEYAARANTQTHFSFGNDETPLGEYAWFVANSEQQPHPVGTRKANPFGLYDMYGNVSEWVDDCAHDGYRGAPSDGSAWTSGNCMRRVVRGGSWIDRASSLRSANRDWFNSDQGRDSLGLRVARALAK
jgi:formylglycine-generating enzyme required for sulfatase activity